MKRVQFLALCALLLVSVVATTTNCTCGEGIPAERWEFGSPVRDVTYAELGPDARAIPEVGCRPRADAACEPCLSSGAGDAHWERHDGRGVICWDESYEDHGARGEYVHARIPPPGHSGWEAAGRSIQFEAESALCGEAECECLDGGDFTYYQTYFGVPAGLELDSLRVEIRNVDDGARITVFNTEHPNGVTPEGSYAFLGGGSTTELADVLAEGTNRVVITHVDDCCRHRRISGVAVRLNDARLEWCR